jgi:NhaP-type Na+/H+ and K+/H+ antiporter
VLVFLGIGMLAGSEGIARIPFDDYAFAFRIGSPRSFSFCSMPD